MSHVATSGILYVRASLRPFARQIKKAGSLPDFLRETFDFDEVFAPYFTGARPFWRERRDDAGSNSGALGRLLAAQPGAVTSTHATHRFVGVGERVGAAFARHGATAPCFQPIADLANGADFSMLLLGCVEESPGFSTVHAVQEELGLTRKHLIRYLFRWDVPHAGGTRAIVAPEAPGCSLSFGKFYDRYAADDNLVDGTLDGQRFIYVRSARRAMSVEREILARNPRFVECGRWNCETCRLRLY